MDNVVAIGLLVVATIVSVLALINVGVSGVTRGNEALNKANEVAAERMKTRVQIVHSSGDTDTDQIVLYAKNVGKTDLVPADQCDLFIISPSQGKLLDYGSGDDYWTYDIMESGGQTPDEWSDGVTVEFTLHMADLDTGYHTITLVTPNGAEFEHYLDVE